MNFVDRREELPAQADIQSKVAVDAPVILEERAEGAVALSDRAGEALAIAHVSRKAQQEVGLGVPGVLVREADLPRSPVIADGRDVVVAIAEEMEAHSECVRAGREAGRVLA